MNGSRFLWISDGTLVVAVGLFAGSFLEVHLYSAPGTGLDAAWSNAGGFSYERQLYGGVGGPLRGKVMAEHVAVPTYPLVLLAGGWLAWRCHRVRGRPSSGCCPRCGYDLRATPTRCPECGAVPGGEPVHSPGEARGEE